MSKTQERQQRNDVETAQRATMDAVIREQVLHVLGEPGSLLKVQVRRLWEDHYRVNVLVGASLACASIANSFFLRVDSEGKIVDARPKILKQY